VTAAFINEPLLELRRTHVRDQALAALAELDARLPLHVPILIGGEEAPGGSLLRSVDPGAPSRVVAEAQAATAEHVDRAVALAERAWRDWGARGAEHRAAVLSRAAGHLRARRLELAALAVRECAKPWKEADADVAEAIDFLEYYGTQAQTLAAGGGRELLQVPGEHNALRYVPRGVVGVVAPWNFPLAILAGMASAGLAAGNAVVVKPAEQSPACALMVVRALHEAGVPPEALALLPGGDEPGRALVAHPGVHVIAFTGSCAAGLSILEQAARVVPGQHHVKRVVAEMGGKNAILVDRDADLDEAVPAIVTSAFGFAGQKCSAASRVLVHEAVAGALTDRLAGAVETLRVGPAEDFATDVPPLIDAEAQERVARYVERGQADGGTLRARAALDPTVADDGFYVAPAVFDGLPPDSRLLAEEIFGPVVTVEAVASMGEACDRLDASPFALTGGLFSRSPGTVDAVAARVPVGNLYVNREITGAMVGRQPFGGSRLSGTGPKAGGPDYLLQFVEARVVTENTMRHGLVV
jgi:RHH-type proline utilization regulon transcriptional repressor/proline dehydrogenase/delta 1-pyrroline-5-carboxylate dehydrogenase